MREILILLVGAIAGMALGLVLARLIFRIQSIGTLRSYQEDPEDGPYLLLALSKDIYDVLKKKYVLLRIDGHIVGISQK